MKDLKKGDSFWVMTDTSFRFNPDNRINGDQIWTDGQVKRFAKNQSHPRRFIKVKVIQSQGNWKKHTEND